MTLLKHTPAKVAFGGILATLILFGCTQNPNHQNSNANNDDVKNTPTDGNKSDQIAVFNNVPVTSNDPNHEPDVALALQENLNKSGINTKVMSVVPTDIPQMYWATLDNVSPIFVDKSGTYVIQGTVMKIGGAKPVDVSNTMMSKTAIMELQAVDKSEMIIFPAKGETKAYIYVFSDPTCKYCQMLHAEIDQTNSAGIEVRYLAWPRGEELVSLTEQVWCSPDRNVALTEAKQGKTITASNCDNPVREHMALGRKLGISGTPAIFAENGHQLGGYLPSSELIQQAMANKQ